MKRRNKRLKRRVNPSRKWTLLHIGALLFISISSGLPGVRDVMAAAVADKKIRAAIECAQLQREDFSRIPDAATTIMSTEVVAAEAETEEYCAVKGYIQPQIQFEIRLPTRTWNGRYFHQLEPGTARRQAYDPAALAQLRRLSVELTGVGGGRP